MDDAMLVLRELKEPVEVVELLRLRHKVYFEQKHYGARKPLGLDLTAYDPRSRLFGLFRDRELVGGLRLVFRHDQPLASVMRGIRAVVEDVVAEQRSNALPSEQAFDFSVEPDLRPEHVEVEVGRLVVSRGAVGCSAVLKLMVGALAVLVTVLESKFYLYSCAASMAKRYAIVTNPRWTLEGVTGSSKYADVDVLTRSRAGVAAVRDSRYFDCAQSYAAEFAQTGAITLSRALPKRCTSVGFGRYGGV